MALDAAFKARDIREVLDATHMRGRNITFLDDFSRDEILNLWKLFKNPRCQAGWNKIVPFGFS